MLSLLCNSLTRKKYAGMRGDSSHPPELLVYWHKKHSVVTEPEAQQGQKSNLSSSSDAKPSRKLIKHDVELQSKDLDLCLPKVFRKKIRSCTQHVYQGSFLITRYTKPLLPYCHTRSSCYLTWRIVIHKENGATQRNDTWGLWNYTKGRKQWDKWVFIEKFNVDGAWTGTKDYCQWIYPNMWYSVLGDFCPIDKLNTV